LFAASASADTPQTYVQLIIKACPAAEQTGRDHRPDAVTGYYADPINRDHASDRSATVTPELELIFESAWTVIRPRGAIEPKAEKQLRLALARHLVLLASSGITDAAELRHQAIEHFMLEH